MGGAVASFLALVFSCQRLDEPEQPSPCAPCRERFTTNDEAQRKVFTTWETVAPRVGYAVDALDLRCLCFGPGESVAVEGGSIHLPSQWAEAEQTARAVHLALHRKQPPWRSGETLDCPQRIDRAVRAEAEAHALELEVRRALGVTTARYLFEPDFFTLAPGRRIQWLHDYFVAHPQGDGVVPGFVLQYRSRCPDPPERRMFFREGLKQTLPPRK